MAVHRLNMNNYLHCTKEEANLVIILEKPSDGRELPPVYLKKKIMAPTKQKVSDPATATWDPGVLIDPSGMPKEYIDRINWWFDNATEEYIGSLKKTFDTKTFELEVNKARHWLTTQAAFTVTGNGKWASRKEHIGKFLTNWLNRSMLKGSRAGGPR